MGQGVSGGRGCRVGSLFFKQPATTQPLCGHYVSSYIVKMMPPHLYETMMHWTTFIHFWFIVNYTGLLADLSTPLK